MKKQLSREDLMQALTPKKEPVPFGGGAVIVTELGAVALMDLYGRKELQKEDGGLNAGKFVPALVALAVVDGDGNRIFSDEDIPFLESASAAQFAKLSAVARRLNGFADGDEKN